MPEYRSPDVTAFATGVRRTETGGDGAYEKTWDTIRGAPKVGAYGFPSADWPQLAASAGLDGAPWRNHYVQDQVARRLFSALYDKYKDWRLVAVAWKGGEKLADAVAGNPALLDHEKLVEVKKYVDGVIKAASRDDTGKEVPGMRHAANPDTLRPNQAFAGAAGPGPAQQAVIRHLGFLREYARAQYMGTQQPEQGEEVTTDGGDNRPGETMVR